MADRPDAEFISVKYDPRWSNRKPRAEPPKRVGIFDDAGKLMPWAVAALPDVTARVRAGLANKEDIARCVYKELRKLEPLANG